MVIGGTKVIAFIDPFMSKLHNDYIQEFLPMWRTLRGFDAKGWLQLIGIANLPALVAADASALYSRNLLNFLNLLLDPMTGELNLNRDDEIIAGSLVCIGGDLVKKT